MSGGIRNDPSASLHSSNPLHLNMKYPWVLGPGGIFLPVAKCPEPGA